MLCNENKQLESSNFIDGVDFTKADPCLFVVYPAGASGDLLISIINNHYLRTGCEYYGINNKGRVMMYTTDYEFIDQYRDYSFNDEWFYRLASKLAERNLNYSLLDQVIFGFHMYKDSDIDHLLDTFPNAKIIRISPKDTNGDKLLRWLSNSKLKNIHADLNMDNNQSIVSSVDSPRVLDLPFGFMFNKSSYTTHYDQIIDFLELNGRLICFDYVNYYLLKQDKRIREYLISYSKNL